MTVRRIVLKCNGPTSYPSPGGSHPTGGGGLVIGSPITECMAEYNARAYTALMARNHAADEGWTSGEHDGVSVDFCPKHAAGSA